MFEPNRHAERGKALEPVDQEMLGVAASDKVRAMLALCPIHAVTPLRSLPALASELGLASLHVKDESTRLGLGSFKALGGAYAVICLCLAEAGRRLGREVEPSELLSSEVRQVAAGMTVACATDGNHGRSVASGARLVGCRSVIFVHAGVDPERIAAIARFGAEIRHVAGSYDDAVAEAERVAAAEGWTIVSDTSWPGYEHIPALVMQGYTAMVSEALEALPRPPTHVFLQAGVGGFAAAVAGHLSLRLGAECPKVIVVEPARAACLFESARAGQAVRIPDGEPTVMAMLECYEPSLVAWRILSRLAAGFLTVSEDDGILAMNRLVKPAGGDPMVVAGESGGAGLAGLLSVRRDGALAAELGLGPTSRVLLFNTEGATAPATFERLTGLRIENAQPAQSMCTI